MRDPMPDTLATRLCALRTAAGLTQQQLADAAGLHQPVVARLESGAGAAIRGASYHTLRALAAALDCTVEELAGR